MNEELNPTSAAEAEEASATDTAEGQAPQEATETVEPVASAAPVQAAPVTSAPAPASPPSTTSRETAPTMPAQTVVSGPQEFSGEYQGGRSRRIGNDVRYGDISYKNVNLLVRFMDQRGRILSRRKTRVSAKVQRRIVKAIKIARHLALLPFTSDQTRIVRKRR
jgi:small subunit ribosomal protein S18